jgi:hypothetical protein
MEPCLDVRERDRRRPGRSGARERRVRVAVDKNEVGRLGSYSRCDLRFHLRGIGGLQIEPVLGLAEAQLLEEHA